MNSIYRILSKHIEENSAIFELELTASHPIFEGHFPNFPLLPGVVQVEIARHLFEQTLDLKLSLSVCQSVKFNGMINPQNMPQLKVVLRWKQTSEGWDCQTEFQQLSGEILMKMKAKYLKA